MRRLRRPLARCTLDRRGLPRRRGWRSAAHFVLAILYALATGGPAAAQGGLWTQYTAESPAGGPPSSDVRGVLPLAGSVWVATAAGAGTYDGRCWRDATGQVLGRAPDCRSAADHGPPDTLRQHVNLVVAGPGGRLWFGTSRGVAIREPSGRLTPFEPNSGLASADVRDILFDRTGATWFATHLGVFRTKAGSVETFALPSLLAARVLFQDSARDLWVGTQAFGLQRFDGTSWHCYSAADAPRVGVADCAAVLPGDSNQVNALAGDGHGGLWVGTNCGLAHFVGPETVPVPPQLAAETAQIIRALWHDADGRLWIGAESGILISDGDTLRRPAAAPPGLGQVVDIEGDLEGNVWLATDDGLWHYRLAWEPLTLADGAVPRGRRAIAQDRPGNLWFAAEGSALRRSPSGDLERLDPLAHQAAAPAGGTVHAILPQPDGALWFGTSAGLVALEADGSWAEIPLPLDRPYEVTSLTQAHGNTVWLGGDRGLLRLAPDGTWIVEETDLPPQAGIVTLLATRDGGLWAGTPHGLLEIRTGGESRLWDTTASLRDRFISSLYQDVNGALWAGTYSGAGRWLGDEGDQFEPLAALAGKRVLAIGEDSLDRLWFGTQRGVVVQGRQAALTFTPDDGLASYVVRGLFRDSDGQLWISTDNGIQRYRPGRAPPWVGAHLWAGNDQVSPQAGTLDVPWRSAEDVRIELNGGDLATAFGELTFCTRMVGLDDAPQCASVPELRYDLPTGRDYTFEVTARDKDELESETLSLAIQVAATPVLQRGWVQALLVGALALLLLALAVYRIRIYLKRRGETRAQMDILVTLRQQREGAQNHLAQVTIHHLGRQGWRHRWQALQKRQWASLLTAKESLPPVPLSQSPELLQEMGHLRGQIDALAKRPLWDNTDRQSDEFRLQNLGTELLRTGFPAELVRHLSQARRADLNTRIRLNFQLEHGADLARFPWEYTYDEALGFLGQHTDTALVRYLDVDQPVRLTSRRRLRILLVIAHPVGPHLPNLRTDQEREDIERAVAKLVEQQKVALELLVGKTAAESDAALPAGSLAETGIKDALRARLASDPPVDVIHFIGHAGPPWERAGEGLSPDEMVLYAENDQGGYTSLTSDDLVGMLTGVRNRRRRLPCLLFLNACRTGYVDGARTLVGLIPNVLVKGGLAAAVGMQYPIEDAAARLFAEKFYAALLEHGQVDWATTIGRQSLAEEFGSDLPDWGMPVLYLQSRDGFVFRTY